MKDTKQLPKERINSFEDGMKSDEDDSGDELLTSGLFKVKESTQPIQEEEMPIKVLNVLKFGCAVLIVIYL